MSFPPAPPPDGFGSPGMNEGGSMVSLREDLREGTYTHLAGLTVLLYDYTLTFSWEQERIWSRKKSWFTVFWCMVRYVPLLLKTAAIAGEFYEEWTLNGCRAFSTFSWLSTAIVILIAHLTFLLRLQVCATDQQPLVSGSVCLTVHNITQVTISIALALVFDFVVLIMVGTRCFWLYRRKADPGLLWVLVRDGCGYFGVITFANALNTVGLRETGSSPVLRQLMLTILPAVMASRMILNLRAVDPNEHARLPSRSRSKGSTYDDLSVPDRTFMSSVVKGFKDSTISQYDLRHSRTRQPTSGWWD
ncbi:hypothetical protein BKA62DRAFT_771699 [Auriculariales sp. MPI-PUGE-AT-0066]|nr:hypothetical protein BKA62DRAFT_771699 [Auriculariales sp. MPI-PUGE-AT-0066]